MGINDNRAIANADETNVYFSPSFQSSIAERDTRTVAVVEPNSSKRCTLMLGCTKSGKKLATCVIHQGKDTAGGRIAGELWNPDHDEHCNRIACGVQEKARVNKT